MEKVMILSLLLIALMVGQSCRKLNLCKDQELTFTRQDNNTVKLRLAGYYYGDLTGNNPEKPLVYMLYQNGVFYNYFNVSLIDAQSGNIDFYDSDSRKNHKNSWGVYKITGNAIEIQDWIPSTGCLPIMIQKGEILNDTTFKITSWETSRKKGQQNEVDAIFHFKEYSPKPDSVVAFIK